MKKNAKNILLTAALVVLALSSFFTLAEFFSSEDSIFYAGVQQKLNERFVTASVIFGTTKLVSGVIAALQSIEIEANLAIAGLNVSPLEVLAPVSNAIDKMSNLFLWAMGAIALQKFLMYIAGWLSFKIILPISCLIMGAYLWTNRLNLRNIAVILAAAAVMITATVPVSVEIAEKVEHYFLAETAEKAQQNIENSQSTISALQNEILDTEEKSAWDIFRSNLSISVIQAKIKNTVETALEYGKKLVTDLLTMFVVMLITVLIIPIATMIFLWLVLKWLMNLLRRGTRQCPCPYIPPKPPEE